MLSLCCSIFITMDVLEFFNFSGLHAVLGCVLAAAGLWLSIFILPFRSGVHDVWERVGACVQSDAPAMHERVAWHFYLHAGISHPVTCTTMHLLS